MSSRFEALKDRIGSSLSSAGRAYLETAFPALYARPDAVDAQAQAWIGNLIAGTELQVKGALARINPSLIFKDLPVEVRGYLAAPASLPENFPIVPYELDLKDFHYDVVGLKEAVSAFYVFFPDKKQLLRPYFKLALELRDLSLGGSMGRIRERELGKVAYLALQVAQTAGVPDAYPIGREDRKFIEKFEADRRQRVERRLTEARKKAQDAKVDISFNDPDPSQGWEEFDARCPVCKNWGVLTGWTQYQCAPDGSEERLVFLSEAFDCNACGLAFDDVEEMRLARMPVSFDRSEDLPRWKDGAPEPAKAGP